MDLGIQECGETSRGKIISVTGFSGYVCVTVKV